MYYLIKDGKISDSSEKYLFAEGFDTIDRNFTSEELEKIKSGYSYNIETGEFEETPESIEFEKQKEIQEFKEIEKKAKGKRQEYLTAELLPDGIFKEMKLAKLIKEGDDIKVEYENKMQELIDKYGESILNELI